MSEKKPTFTEGKLKSVLTQLEQIKNRHDEENEKKRDKDVLFIKSYLDHLKKNKEENPKPILFELLKLGDDILERFGGELMDKFYEMYNDDELLIQHHSNLEIHFYFLYTFFNGNELPKKLLDLKIIDVDIPSRKISTNLEKISQLTIDDFSSINLIIDLMFIRIFTQSKIQTFYTTITGMLMNVNHNIVRFLKVLSLFALCYWVMKKKEDFIGSLLFVAGGVLRDLARCYLKTRSVFNENLSYHKCSKGNKEHDTHFFPAVTLLERDCDYFKEFTLEALQKFLEMILLDFNVESTPFAYDDYIPLLDSVNEENLADIEKDIPGAVRIINYIYLFLSDFVFFFLSNFTKCEFDDKGIKFVSGFGKEEEFMKFVLLFFTENTRNLYSLWNYSQRYHKFLETKCEKTEYVVGDRLNHYGICFIFMMMVSGHYTIEGLHSFLPLVVKKEVFDKCFNELVEFIFNTEIGAEFTFTTQYKEICVYTLKMIKKKGATLSAEIKELMTKAGIDAKEISELYNN